MLLQDRIIKNIYLSSIISFLFFFILGCGGGVTSKYYIKQGYIPPVRRVAVLPFENITNAQSAGKAVFSVFFTELCNAQLFDVVEPGEVDSFLVSERIRATSTMDLKTAQKMLKKLNVDAVFLGSVTEYGDVNIESEQLPVVGVSVRMLDTKDGQILWSASHSRVGNDKETLFGFGKIKSISALSGIVVKDLISSLKENFGTVYIKDNDDYIDNYAFLSDDEIMNDNYTYIDYDESEEPEILEDNYIVKSQQKVKELEEKSRKVGSMIDEFEGLLDKYTK